MEDNEDYDSKKPINLTNRGREIKKLLRTYQKPYWWKTNTELQRKQKNNLKCSECGGDLTKGDAYMVCTSCGLEHEKIYDKGTLPQDTESLFHKQNRKEIPHKRVVKHTQDLVNVKILKSINEQLKTHLKKHRKKYINKPKYAWICEAILLKIKEDQRYAKILL